MNAGRGGRFGGGRQHGFANMPIHEEDEGQGDGMGGGIGGAY